jgi:hypothetical protein
MQKGMFLAKSLVILLLSGMAYPQKNSMRTSNAPESDLI